MKPKWMWKIGLVACFVLVSIFFYKRAEEKALLGWVPPELRAISVIDHGLWAERNCKFAVYRLDPAVWPLIKQQGLAFFAQLRTAYPGYKIYYEPWRSTPVKEDDKDEDGMPSGFHCYGGEDTFEIQELLSKEGSFYALRSTQTLAVLPEKKIVIYASFD